MKKGILLIGLLSMTGTLTAQVQNGQSYYIQTAAGTCLTNQYLEDELALLQLQEPQDSIHLQQWTFRSEGNHYRIVNPHYQRSVDNVGTPYLNLFQREVNTTAESQQWDIVAVPGQKDYYFIQSVNFPQRRWEANYNGTICLAEAETNRHSQWFRLSKEVQPADTTLLPDPQPQPGALLGTTALKFSTSTHPVWYQMSPHYSNSPVIIDTRLIAYFDKSQQQWLIKGAADTRLNNTQYTDPDMSLWRLEGNEKSFRLINKAQGLALTDPAQPQPKARYRLTEKGSLYRIAKSKTLSEDMEEDAYFLEPLDAKYFAKGRVHVDGATCEMMLYKNNIADVVGGKGSTLIFIEVPMKKVSVSSSDSLLGTVNIKQEAPVTGCVEGQFTYGEATAYEPGTTVTRSRKNPVETVAGLHAKGEFNEWTDAEGHVLSTELVYIYTGEKDAQFTAHFSPLTAIESVQAQDYFRFEHQRNDIVLTSKVKSAQVITLSGKVIGQAEKVLHLQNCPQGNYVLLLHLADSKRIAICFTK